MSRSLYLFLVLTFCLTWSSAFPAAKLAIQIAPPLLYLGVRFGTAAALLLGFAGIRGKLNGSLPWLPLLLLGVLNQSAYQGMSWLGMRTVSSGLTTIITSMNPILISALAVPMLGERMTARKLVGLALGFAGSAFVVRNRILETGEDPYGIMFVVVGTIAATFGTLLFKRIAPNIDLVSSVGAQQLGASIALIAVGLLIGERFDAFSSSTMLFATMLWFVFVVSIGAFLLWFYLLRIGTASAASSLHFLMPPLGLLMSWAVLGEALHPIDLLGVIPVALGIRLATTETG